MTVKTWTLLTVINSTYCHRSIGIGIRNIFTSIVNILGNLYGILALSRSLPFPVCVSWASQPVGCLYYHTFVIWLKVMPTPATCKWPHSISTALAVTIRVLSIDMNGRREFRVQNLYISAENSVVSHFVQEKSNLSKQACS